MMEKKEYIERGALISRLEYYYSHTSGDIQYAYGVALKEVRSAPSADVVEVVHGEWIIKTDYKTPVSHAYIRKEKLYICPYCGKDYRKHMNFCGNCGAKMDGGKHDTD